MYVLSTQGGGPTSLIVAYFRQINLLGQSGNNIASQAYVQHNTRFENWMLMFLIKSNCIALMLICGQ